MQFLITQGNWACGADISLDWVIIEKPAAADRLLVHQNWLIIWELFRPQELFEGQWFHQNLICEWNNFCIDSVSCCVFQFVLGFSIVIHSPVTYGDYVYPGWAIGVGWIFALCSLIPLPLNAGIKIYNETGPFMQVSIRLWIILGSPLRMIPIPIYSSDYS